jgi:hypothetical protein
VPFDLFQLKCEILDPLIVGTSIDKDISVTFHLNHIIK